MVSGYERSFRRKKTRFSEKQVIGGPKQMDAGRKVADLAREVGMSEDTLYARKSKFGWLEVSEARRLKESRNGRPSRKCFVTTTASKEFDNEPGGGLA